MPCHNHFQPHSSYFEERKFPAVGSTLLCLEFNLTTNCVLKQPWYKLCGSSTGKVSTRSFKYLQKDAKRKVQYLAFLLPLCSCHVTFYQLVFGSVVPHSSSAQFLVVVGPMFQSSPRPVGGAVTGWEEGAGTGAPICWEDATWPDGTTVSAPQSVAGPVVSAHCCGGKKQNK